MLEYRFLYPGWPPIMTCQKVARFTPRSASVLPESGARSKESLH